MLLRGIYSLRVSQLSSLRNAKYNLVCTYTSWSRLMELVHNSTQSNRNKNLVISALYINTIVR